MIIDDHELWYLLRDLVDEGESGPWYGDAKTVMWADEQHWLEVFKAPNGYMWVRLNNRCVDASTILALLLS